MTSGEDAEKRLLPELTGLRHELHAIPELGLELPATQGLILDALSGLDLEVRTGTRCSSITAVLHGSGTTHGERPVTLLRADMDALPIEERAEVDYRSRHRGRMHACGHDLHMAMLVGAAKTLCSRRDEVKGDVIFAFQPGEEEGGGAEVMLSEGLLQVAGRGPDVAWALHVLSGTVPRGQVLSRQGPLMAASNQLHVTVRGMGGHGSAPHRAKDPVPVAAAMVGGLQTIMTRTVSAFAPAVLTVGRFNAGNAAYIIPESASFAATIRCFDAEVLDRLEHDVVRFCRGVADSHGLDADVRFERHYPVTVNAGGAVTVAEEVVGTVLGQRRWEWMPNPTMLAEDFSRILERVPGAMLLLGASTGGEEWQTSADNHSPYATFSDEVLADGAALHAALAVRSLSDMVSSRA
jgi:hippurate hydrolase